MPPDCYKVEVLFCFNPHLIWVEVRDPIIAKDGYKFEQIGIYGILPLETTINLEDEEIAVHDCKKWLPAATTLMKNFWGRKDVWFVPAHIDRRSSIFDDNVHTFGDLIVKTSDGRSKSLTKLLRTSGFATYDACLFHQYLSEGRIITKLDNVSTQEVVQELEKYYKNNNEPSKYSDTPVKNHTSVSRASLDLEGALTTTNVSKHNHFVKALLENKRRDLEFCKGVDERSVGRGSVRKLYNKKEQTAAEKKLELFSGKKRRHASKTRHVPDPEEQVQTFEHIRTFLERNSTPYPEKISNKTDAHKAQILKKIMCKPGKNISKQEMLVKRLLNDSRHKSNTEEQSVAKPEVSDDLPLATNQFEASSSEISTSNYNEIPIEDTKDIKQSNFESAQQKLVELGKSENSTSISDHKESSKNVTSVSVQEELVQLGKSEIETSPSVCSEIPKNDIIEVNQQISATKEAAEDVKTETSKNVVSYPQNKPAPKKPSSLVSAHEKFLKLRIIGTSTSSSPQKEIPKVINENTQSNSVSAQEKSAEVKTEASSSTLEKQEIIIKNMTDNKQSSSVSLKENVVKGAQSEISTPEQKETPNIVTNEKKQAQSIPDEERVLNSVKVESSSSISYLTHKNGVVQGKGSSNSKETVAEKNFKTDVQSNDSTPLSQPTNNTKNTQTMPIPQPANVPLESVQTAESAALSAFDRSKLESRPGNIIKKPLDTTNRETLDALRKRKLNSEMTENKKKSKVLSTASEKYVPPPATKSKKSKKKGKKGNVKKGTSKAAFGPPGIDLTKLNCRVPPIHLYDEDDLMNQKVGSSKRNNADADSTATWDGNDKEGVPSCSYENKQTRNERKESLASGSSLWEKRLKLHKEMAKNKRCASYTADTINIDTSKKEVKTPSKNFKAVTEDDTTYESSSEVMEALKNSVKTVSSADGAGIEVINTCSDVVRNANPFRNFDSDMSVFVDNLVTPVMLVHSKMNKCPLPTCFYRDVHFSNHIRLALKNMHICRPMMLQTMTWSSILRGYSVFMIGAAASGKTMGYLPAVCRLVTDSSMADSDGESVGPISIIVCATSQSVSVVEKIAKMLVGCNEKVVSCHCGHNETEIAISILNGCEILISTAPSLVRLLQIPELGVDLRRLEIFVLDDCERLSEVYSKELKYCLHRVNDMLKTRVNRELKVQYVAASRTWCDFMEPLAKAAPDTVVCIGTFQECIIYARANMTVSYVKKCNKLKVLLQFLEDVDPSKRTVVVCDSDEEVNFLNKAIQALKYFVFASNNKMTVQDLYNLSLLWREFREPMTAPVLICRDSNLYHMNIVNANYLVQYSMPSLYSTFCRRFSTLNDSYPSIFQTDKQDVKILILLEDGNVEQFPKIINFIKRCRTNIPEFINGICGAVAAKNDAKKGKHLTALCSTLLSSGDCPELQICKYRHTIQKQYDEPKKWMPTSGIVTFKIIHYHTATLYSARLIGNFDIGSYVKYPSAYSNISMKMGVYFANKKNRVLLGVPKVGDICAVSSQSHMFVRCQVITIMSRYPKGTPKTVLINMIDEELFNVTADTNLYHLPDHLKEIDTYVVRIRLANVQPRDKDIVFSELAKNQLEKCIAENDNIYMKGQIALTIGNCIFVDTLEACQDLKSLNETVVTYNLKRELLVKHAKEYPEHIPKLQALCRNAHLGSVPTENAENPITKPAKDVPLISWAFLDRDLTKVYLGCVEDPDTLFVRLTKFEDLMKKLMKDIQKYVSSNPAKMGKFKKNDIVLAQYPDDSTYRRGRIDVIKDTKIQCFFVDQGESLWLTKDKFIPIEDSLIRQLPFQAIECRLVGIERPGDQWTNFSINWLFDKCFESNCGGLKQLFVKHFTKESAQFSGGHKYGVVLMDVSTGDEYVINQAMIDLNLAKEKKHETKYFDYIKVKKKAGVESNKEEEEEEEEDDDWENVSKDLAPSNNLQVSNELLPRQLVESDEELDNFEGWHLQMVDELLEIFKAMYESSTHRLQPEFTASVNEETERTEPQQIDLARVANIVEKGSENVQLVTINPDSINELDSDDLSSPEPSLSSIDVKKVSHLRKPKLIWRQTRATVMIKIQLIGVESYEMEIDDRALKFSATVNDTSYGFELELYGVIDKNDASHSNKGQYILVKFNKKLNRNWLTLCRHGEVQKWIVYDVDSIDTSSDEEDVQRDDLVNIVKTMHNKADSDTEEDDFEDDVNFRYKNDD